jgi:sortase A
MDTPKTLLLLVSLVVVLCVLVVPVLPEKETAHAKLETTTDQNTGMLLGENSPKLNPPDEAPSEPSNITAKGANVSSAMKITVPRLGLKDVAVPTGSRQAELDKQGIMHLRGSGLPWMAGSNTFITGHALGFPWTRVPYALYKLD